MLTPGNFFFKQRLCHQNTFFADVKHIFYEILELILKSDKLHILNKD